MSTTLEAAVAPPPDPMRPQPFVVRRIAHETADTVTLTLAAVEAGGGLPFEPGQFNMLYVLGVGEVPISIGGDPERPERLVHTVRAVGATTRALSRLGRGDRVGVRGPFGTSWPLERAAGHDLVLVAGGMGLAPLHAAVCRLLARRDRYGRIALLYGTRSPADVLYARELDQWRSGGDLDLEVAVERGTLSWQGSVGTVTRLIERAGFDPARATAFLCGPEPMMRISALALERRGVGLNNVFVSLQRNIQCGVGLCGHCQLGPVFACTQGPVFRYDRLQTFFGFREV